MSEEAVYAYEITAVDRAYNEGAPSGQIALPVDVRGRGDWDGDGLVGLGDFFMLAERFGRQLGDSEFSTDFDMNGDGQIDFADFFSFVDLFGTRYGAARVEWPSPRLHLQTCRCRWCAQRLDCLR